MKAISDLLEPAGTPLYPLMTTCAMKQCRWQDHIVSKDSSIYLNSKRAASAWVSAASPRVERLSGSLLAAHRELLVEEYRLLNTLAQGMELFVDDWRRKTPV